MTLRTFNDAGMVEAAAVLQKMREGLVDDIPRELMESEEFSTSVGTKLAKPQGREVSTRWELGLWLHTKLEVDALGSHVRSRGFWTWLAFYLFDLICPPGTPRRRPKEDARYILSAHYQRSYRHLLAGPYFLIRAHEDAPGVVKGLLGTSPESPGDIYEQLASRKDVVTSRPAMQAVTRLYWDSAGGKLRRGAASSARRLADVLMQYEVTFDLYAIDSQRLLDLLPREFDRFRSK